MGKDGKQTGFSLIEMMVIIAIVSIMAGIAIPNLLSYVPNWRLKNAATDLYSNLQLARTTAIKEGSICRVTFSGSPDQYSVVCKDKTVTLGDYKSGVRFDGLGTASIGFTPSGFADATSSISLTNSGGTRRYTISVLVSGQISIQ
jgi:type II secretion system protein H